MCSDWKRSCSALSCAFDRKRCPSHIPPQRNAFYLISGGLHVAQSHGTWKEHKSLSARANLSILDYLKLYSPLISFWVFTLQWIIHQSLFFPFYWSSIINETLIGEWSVVFMVVLPISLPHIAHWGALLLFTEGKAAAQWSSVTPHISPIAGEWQSQDHCRLLTLRLIEFIYSTCWVFKLAT